MYVKGADKTPVSPSILFPQLLVQESLERLRLRTGRSRVF